MVQFATKVSERALQTSIYQCLRGSPAPALTGKLCMQKAPINLCRSNFPIRSGLQDLSNARHPMTSAPCYFLRVSHLHLRCCLFLSRFCSPRQKKKCFLPIMYITHCEPWGLLSSPCLFCPSPGALSNPAVVSKREGQGGKIRVPFAIQIRRSNGKLFPQHSRHFVLESTEMKGIL